MICSYDDEPGDYGYGTPGWLKTHLPVGTLHRCVLEVLAERLTAACVTVVIPADPQTPEIVLHEPTDEFGTGAGANGEWSVLFESAGVFVVPWRGVRRKVKIYGRTVAELADDILRAVDIDFGGGR